MPFVNRGAAFAEDTSVTVDLSGSTVFFTKHSDSAVDQRIEISRLNDFEWWP